jgi:branched-chain amino acid transport system ATP-binding protein
MSADPMNTPLLEVDQLTVCHGKVAAVSDLSLSVRAGELVTVIGPNGAGKSTLMAALIGALRPAGGSVRFAGERVDALRVERHVARGLALVPEARALFASMSVRDNLLLGAYRHRGESAAQRQSTLDEVFTLFPRLAERRDQSAATLSGGERQMLALGRALMGRPRLLMLDEPSLGLAPLIVREIFRILLQLKSQGMTILLVEQNARAALRVADEGLVLELGRCVARGPAADLARDERIVQAYLGLSGGHQEKLVEA